MSRKVSFDENIEWMNGKIVSPNRSKRSYSIPCATPSPLLTRKQSRHSIRTPSNGRTPSDGK